RAPERRVNRHAPLRFVSVVMHVAGDADDLDGRAAVVLDVFADGVALGPEPPRQPLVDHHDGGALGDLARREVAALFNADAHSLEIICRDDVPIHVDEFARTYLLVLAVDFGVDVVLPAGLEAGQLVDDAGGFDAGQGVDAVEQL